MSPDTYTQADTQGFDREGHQCANCGHPGFEHDKTQVEHSNGRRRFEMRCPA